LIEIGSYEAPIEYGKTRAELARKGVPIKPLDMLIATHAKCRHIGLLINYHGKIEVLGKRKKTKKTAFTSTHNMTVAEQICYRIEYQGFLCLIRSVCTNQAHFLVVVFPP